MNLSNVASPLPKRSPALPVAHLRVAASFVCPPDIDAVAFGSVFRALTGAPLSAADLVAHAHVLDFFGIEPRAVLVDTANSNNVAGERDVLCF